ncbi:hypothetical protein CPB85DRAFT_1438342 [Mucidula mucida]|nr:hypothetical protein CPB85DRAFT_1438342 [Mucidula mucida]
MPSSASSSAPSTTTIPRPPNSFILFRQEYARLYADPKTLVSKSAGEAWRALSDEDKQYYTAVEKEKHAEKYPAYRFRPQKKEIGPSTHQMDSADHNTPYCQYTHEPLQLSTSGE